MENLKRSLNDLSDGRVYVRNCVDNFAITRTNTGPIVLQPFGLQLISIYDMLSIFFSLVRTVNYYFLPGR